ncbi:unnamed protein product [Cyprideis torosa]|uniref:Uncharacterized protein n=1 Tax=Cyprideis torosa TaxID=163714 RepID=A0A7R8WAB8_9CRUS|nr:unnamed protein product [Cyprideis torosa]CAG0885720.1 unnamed protein product [Cyprideis torosa]
MDLFVALLSLACLVAAAQGDSPPRNGFGGGGYAAPQPPAYRPPPQVQPGGQGSYGGGQQQQQHGKGMPYQFQYAVNDQYSGNDFGQEEQSDGNVVRGRYYVQLPDGRRQIVTYTADHQNGYQAQVEYEGEAQYPQGPQGGGGRPGGQGGKYGRR